MQLTDKALEVLCFMVKCLSTLQYLNVDFSDCDQMTDKGLQYLGYELSRHPGHLQSLTMNLNNCDLITEEAKNYFNQTLQIIPQLTICD